MVWPREPTLTPRDPERGLHRRRTTHAPERPSRANTENALDDFYGGTANIAPSRHQSLNPGSYRPSQNRASRPWARPRPPPPPSSDSIIIGDIPIPATTLPSPARLAGRRFEALPASQPPPPPLDSPASSPADITDEPDETRSDWSLNEGLFLSEPPDGDWTCGEWACVARETGPRGVGAQVLSLKPSLVMLRHGLRVQSNAFPYETGWTDKRFANVLKYQYAHLKLKDVGFLQKMVAYKQIAYVVVLQTRCLKKNSRWVVVKSVPITNKGDKEGRDAFMYRLRYPADFRRWTETVDGLIKPGVVLYFEIIETFDASKINVGVLVAATLTLAVALVYGFAMDGDFGTGFTIAGWLITAVLFFAASVSISDFAGQESLTSNRVDDDDSDYSDFSDLSP